MSLWNFGRHTRTWCGLTYQINIDHDEFASAPWEDSDGHGPVSEWTGRDKRPGELVLCKDRDRRRYYDYADACRIARQEGWGAPGCPENATPRQKAAHAAMADYEYLRGWCNDDWCYVWVNVELMLDGEPVQSESCGGFSSDDDEGLEDFFMDAARMCVVNEGRIGALPVPSTETPVRVWKDEPPMPTGTTRVYDGVEYAAVVVTGHAPEEWAPHGYCAHCPARGAPGWCGVSLCGAVGHGSFIVRAEDVPLLALRGNLK